MRRALYHILAFLFGTLLAGVAIYSIIWFTNPTQASPAIHTALYAAVFLCMLGISFIINIIIRIKFFPGMYVIHFNTALRQAFLLAILVAGMLLLQGQGILYWWLALIFAAVIISLEFFFHL